MALVIKPNGAENFRCLGKAGNTSEDITFFWNGDFRDWIHHSLVKLPCFFHINTSSKRYWYIPRTN